MCLAFVVVHGAGLLHISAKRVRCTDVRGDLGFAENLQPRSVIACMGGGFQLLLVDRVMFAGSYLTAARARKAQICR